jgi:hypothetical protein
LLLLRARFPRTRRRFGFSDFWDHPHKSFSAGAVLINR